ncbi:hypothetical protein BDW60DRAFT_76317 [Aspergillus nidulans var. acristatus]
MYRGYVHDTFMSFEELIRFRWSQSTLFRTLYLDICIYCIRMISSLQRLSHGAARSIKPLYQRVQLRAKTRTMISFKTADWPRATLRLPSYIVLRLGELWHMVASDLAACIPPVNWTSGPL